jgi:parvulin-like peptidyl-prolyl isomerase
VQGGESFEDLARAFSDEKETKGFGGSMGEITMKDLPPSMKEQLDSMKDGDISEPLPYAADPTKPGYHILYRKKTIPSHQPNLDDDYKAIERMATFAKKQRLEQDWVDDLRTKLYWEKR